MDAAVSVFAERGILAASVEEICERAGFTRGAFYSNFDSKDDLYFALLRREHDRHFAATQQAIAEVTESIDDQPVSAEELGTLVHRAMILTLRTMRSDREAILAGYEMRLYAIRKPEVTAPFRAFLEESYEMLAALVREALDRTGSKLVVDVDDLLPMVIAIFEHNQLDLLLEGAGEEAEERLADQLSTLLRALAAPDSE